MRRCVQTFGLYCISNLWTLLYSDLRNIIVLFHRVTSKISDIHWLALRGSQARAL